MKLTICICLSHEVSRKGMLSDDSKMRIRKASEVFVEKQCDFLITTGWKKHQRLNYSVADFMANEANIICNIPRDKIIKESKPKDTVGEAIFSKLLIYRDFTFEKLIIHIVTSDWHKTRAQEIFNFVYAEENTKLEFIEIKGSREEAINEDENSSIEEFRKLVSACQPGNTKEIYQLLKRDHKLYSEGR